MWIEIEIPLPPGTVVAQPFRDMLNQQISVKHQNNTQTWLATCRTVTYNHAAHTITVGMDLPDKGLPTDGWQLAHPARTVYEPAPPPTDRPKDMTTWHRKYTHP